MDEIEKKLITARDKMLASRGVVATLRAYKEHIEEYLKDHNIGDFDTLAEQFDAEHAEVEEIHAYLQEHELDDFNDFINLYNSMDEQYKIEHEENVGLKEQVKELENAGASQEEIDELKQEYESREEELKAGYEDRIVTLKAGYDAEQDEKVARVLGIYKQHLPAPMSQNLEKGRSVKAALVNAIKYLAKEIRAGNIKVDSDLKYLFEEENTADSDRVGVLEAELASVRSELERRLTETPEQIMMEEVQEFIDDNWTRTGFLTDVAERVVLYVSGLTDEERNQVRETNELPEKAYKFIMSREDVTIDIIQKILKERGNRGALDGGGKGLKISMTDVEAEEAKAPERGKKTHLDIARQAAAQKAGLEKIMEIVERDYDLPKEQKEALEWLYRTYTDTALVTDIGSGKVQAPTTVGTKVPASDGVPSDLGPTSSIPAPAEQDPTPRYLSSKELAQRELEKATTRPSPGPRRGPQLPKSMIDTVPTEVRNATQPVPARKVLKPAGKKGGLTPKKPKGGANFSIDEENGN